MKLVNFGQKIFTLIAAVIVAIAAFATPALADENCYVKGDPFRPGGDLKADVYASPSFLNSPIGSAFQSDPLKVKARMRDAEGNQWAKYESSLTASRFAYIPIANLTNCKTITDGVAGGTNCKEAYQQGYNAGFVEATKRRN